MFIIQENWGSPWSQLVRKGELARQLMQRPNLMWNFIPQRILTHFPPNYPDFVWVLCSVSLLHSFLRAKCVLATGSFVLKIRIIFPRQGSIGLRSCKQSCYLRPRGQTLNLTAGSERVAMVFLTPQITVETHLGQNGYPDNVRVTRKTWWKRTRCSGITSLRRG